MDTELQSARTGQTAGHRLLDTLAVVLAVALGLTAFALAARAQLRVGPAQLAVELSPALRGRTVVELPPFGSVSAPTHRGPLRLTVRVEELDVARTAGMLQEGTLSLPDTIGSNTTGELGGLGLTAAAWRSIGGGLLAAAGAALLCALALRRGRGVVALAVGLAIALPSLAAGIAYATWDISGFREPVLRGSLTHAPQLVNMFSTRVATIERLRDEAATVARDIAAYYSDERGLASGGALPGTYRVLHVSDLHLDPVGAGLARSIARSYEASLVVDTGDLPILGTTVEGRLFASVVDTSVPRLYVPGNHDSAESIAALERLGVTVLTSGTVEIDGIKVLGVADPFSRGFGVEPEKREIENVAALSFARLEAVLRSGESTPDIVAIHNPLMEAPFVGQVPLIVSGHTHSARLYISKGTVRLNSGTLGGMPYDPEATDRRALPYGLSVLYFTAEEPRRLIAIDRIAVSSTRSTTISRDVIDESLLP